MFTWICPQCGREVPPSYTECPDCTAKAAAAGSSGATAETAAAPAAPAPAPAAQTGPVAPQSQYPPPGGQYYPPPPYPQQYQPPYPPYPQQYPPQPPYAGQQPYPQGPYPNPPYPPPQYTGQYGPPSYAPPYPPPAYAPVPDKSEPLPSAPPPPPRATSALFAPPESPAAPPPPMHVVEPQHEPGAPRPGGTLFGAPSAAPETAQRKGLPTWLLTVLFAAGFGILVVGIYALVGSNHGAKPSTTVESPAAKPGAPTNAWQKFVEVSGVRFTENAKKQPVVKYVLTNHSGMEIEGLAGNVTIWGRTQKSEEEAAGTFTFNTNLPPYSAKDLESPLTTKLKIYELPDWQNVSTDLQVTAPGGTNPTAQK